MRTPASVAEVRATPYVSHANTAASRRPVTTPARRIAVHGDFPLADEPLVVHRINEFSIAAALLAESDLVALLPRHTSAAYRSPSLRLRPLPRGLTIARHIDVLARPEAMQRASVRAVLGALRRVAGELTDGSPGTG